MASDIAMVLMGKNRPTYTPHIDNGDYVVVINADKSVLTGRKVAAEGVRLVHRPSGPAPGDGRQAQQRRPELILREAVRRMLPKNKLAFKTLTKLKIYAGSEHPHQAQLPEAKELGIKD